MGVPLQRALLSSQFVAGINPTLKPKVEEAKLKEFAGAKQKVVIEPTPNKPEVEGRPPPATISRIAGLRCDICDSPHHLRGNALIGNVAPQENLVES